MNFTYHTIFPKWRNGGMELFDKIRILRKARGLSQEQLGYSLSRVNKDGISRQTVSDWENGNFEPKLDNIRDLAEVLNVSFDTLLDESVDLNDEKVLNAVLNQQPYEIKNNQKIEKENKSEPPVIKRCNITLKEIALLVITGYMVIGSVVGFNSVIHSLVLAVEQSDIVSLVVQLIFKIIFFGLSGVAFAFLIPAILKKKTPKVTMILLLIIFGIEFAIFAYSSVMSFIGLANYKPSSGTTYYVNQYRTTYDKIIASTIVNLLLSLITTACFTTIMILVIRAYKKEQLEEKKLTANGNKLS